MLNKNEKKNLEYIKTITEDLNDFYFKTEKLFPNKIETREICYNCGSWVLGESLDYENILRKMYEKLQLISTYLEKILDEKFVKRQDCNQKSKRRLKTIEKRNKEEEKITHKERTRERLNLMRNFQRIKMKLEDKTNDQLRKESLENYIKGLKEGKEIARLSDDQILSKAEMIRLNKEIEPKPIN